MPKKYTRKALAQKCENIPQEESAGPDKGRHVAQFEQEVMDGAEMRVGMLKAAIDERIANLRQELHIQLSLLPKYVLEMEVREFEEKYGGDVSKVRKSKAIETPAPEVHVAPIAEEREEIAENRQEAAVQSEREECPEGVDERNSIGAETTEKPPELATPNIEATTAVPVEDRPKSSVRMPRPGEVLCSVNGSPLGVYGPAGFAPIRDDRPLKQFAKTELE